MKQHGRPFFCGVKKLWRDARGNGDWRDINQEWRVRA
jgi:hypothetical protein